MADSFTHGEPGSSHVYEMDQKGPTVVMNPGEKMVAEEEVDDDADYEGTKSAPLDRDGMHRMGKKQQLVVWLFVPFENVCFRSTC